MIMQKCSIICSCIGLIFVFLGTAFLSFKIPKSGDKLKAPNLKTARKAICLICFGTMLQLIGQVIVILI